MAYSHNPREVPQFMRSAGFSMKRFLWVAALVGTAVQTSLAASLAYNSNTSQTVNQLQVITAITPTMSGVTGAIAYSVATGALPSGVALIRQPGSSAGHRWQPGPSPLP